MDASLPSPCREAHTIRVEPASRPALHAVRAAYAAARAIQRSQGPVVWPEFSDESIVSQMDAGELFCVYEDGELLGVFTVAWEDEAIWGDLERGAHLYLHRLARSMTRSSRSLVSVVLEWAHAECRRRGRAGLRLDTWADNEVLVSMYERHGFHLVERRRMGTDSRLSPHYRGTELALLEAPCDGADYVA